MTPDPRGQGGTQLLRRLQASKADREIRCIAVACVAGRDSFWVARWLQARGIEAYVIHPTSVAVCREPRRAKTDRLDRHGPAQAYIPRLAARRAGSLPNGRGSDL